MHFRGKDMKWELMRPDAIKETLLAIPRYDFNWQIEYKLKDPVDAPKGSRLIVTAHFDNSVNNPSNPDPTKTVRWGEPLPKRWPLPGFSTTCLKKVRLSFGH